MSTQVTFILLFLVVVAVIAVGAWLVRRFAGNRLGANASRGRMPRLAVIDAAAVDNRRKLVLVRRDNVEHLIMIGGPSDIVIEPNIVRAMPQRDPGMARGPVAAELPPRVALPDTDRWDAAADAQEHHEPLLPDLPPPRPTRSAFPDEGRRPAPSAADRRMVDPLAGLAPEPALRPEPVLRPEPPQRSRPLPRSERSEPPVRNEPMMPRSEALSPRSEPRAEPMMPRAPALPIEPAPKSPPARAERPAPPPAPPAPSEADQNLAEMAQRLEAALRRPNEAPDRAPPVAPEAPGRGSRAAAEPAAPPVASSGPKISLDNLEDEMASLLGRPKSPS